MHVQEYGTAPQCGLTCFETSRPIPQRSNEIGASIPLGGRRHQSPWLRRLRLSRRPSEHEVHKLWCDHVEWCINAWSIPQSAFALSSGEEEIVRYDKSDSSAQWYNQHGQRLWGELDRSCAIRLQQCNRNSPQR